MSSMRQKQGKRWSVQVPKAHSDIWFNDGTIILEAENTQFRVYRGLLEKHSSVLKDIFAGLQYKSRVVSVDGCPVVHLSDRSQDVHHLLHALYDCFYNSFERQPVPILAAMIRLGHKYNITKLRDDALSRLKHEYPSTLETWTAGLCAGFTRIELDTGDASELDLLLLAREYRLQTILPALYFNLASTFSLEAISDGFERLDGSIVKLSARDIVLCAVGFESLRSGSIQTTFSWLTDLPYAGCTSPDGLKCSDGARSVHFEVFVEFDCNITGLNPWKASWLKQFCRVCGPAAKAAHEEGRREFWNDIPGCFGLPDWEDLTNFA
ncbi:hypothetical protein Hypma_004726 [Hypsizygus marmoreus]|uniref:BTB domain-containing protein n=1 Tax=Hypsizygus marmoreus TaxID=39966 RepID=A0A369J3K7_HYPMA|nr:hypothetical protein Hypma_004726 [Hypsizygus marmoreus]